MLKVNRERRTQRCFAEVLESRHSPLVLVGAPAQGCSSPLIRARIKCSLWVDSSTLRRGESPTTAHNLSWVIHKIRRMITKRKHTNWTLTRPNQQQDLDQDTNSTRQTLKSKYAKAMA